MAASPFSFPSGDQCINGIIFSHLSSCDILASLSCATSEQNYEELRTTLNASLGKRFVADDLSIAEHWLSIWHDWTRNWNYVASGTAAMMNWLTHQHDSSPFMQRHMLDNIAFSKLDNAPIVASISARYDKQTPCAWIRYLMGPYSKLSSWHARQVLRAVWNEVGITWPRLQKIYSDRLLNDYMISREIVNMRDENGNNLLHRGFTARKLTRRVRFTNCRDLHTLGLLDNVDALGHNALQMFAANCKGLTMHHMYKCITYVILSQDPRKVRSTDDTCTVFDQIMEAARLISPRRNMPFCSAGIVTFIRHFLTLETPPGHVYQIFTAKLVVDVCNRY